MIEFNVLFEWEQKKYLIIYYTYYVYEHCTKCYYRLVIYNYNTINV